MTESVGEQRRVLLRPTCIFGGVVLCTRLCKLAQLCPCVIFNTIFTNSTLKRLKLPPEAVLFVLRGAVSFGG